MATIKTSCPFCGDVDLQPSAVTLTVSSYRPWSYYSFACPRCGQGVDKAANETVMGLLRGGGVRIVAWHIPAEALEVRLGEPLTNDDLLDFHAALSGRDDIAAVVSGDERA